MCIRDRERIPSIIDQYKAKNEVLEMEIPQLQEIAGKVLSLIHIYNTTFVFPEAKKDKKFSGRKK